MCCPSLLTGVDILKDTTMVGTYTFSLDNMQYRSFSLQLSL